MRRHRRVVVQEPLVAPHAVPWVFLLGWARGQSDPPPGGGVDYPLGEKEEAVALVEDAVVGNSTAAAEFGVGVAEEVEPAAD